MAIQTKEVVVTDQVIKSMLRSSRFTNVFPFLASAKTNLNRRPGQGCGGCGRATRANKSVLDQVKRTIANLPAKKKLRLKILLGTQEVVVKVKKPKKTIVYRF